MSFKTARLGDVCDVVSGATPKTNQPSFWNGDIPWVTPKDLSLNDSKLLNDTPRKLSDAGLKSCSATMLPPGSVLLSSRAPIGLLAINTLPVCTNQGFKSLVPHKDIISAEFLYWWLKTNRPSIERLGRGATFKEVSKKIVQNIEMPLPDLADQKRIAKILDAADVLRDKRRESIAQLDALLQSTFLEMFGDPMANTMEWPMGVIGDLLEMANYGSSKKADEQAGNFPVIRMNNISYSGSWDFSSLKYIDLSEKEQAKHLVHKGQILFNRTNSKELVGKTAVYRRDEPMAFAGYLVRGVVNQSADPEYIGAFMNTPQMKRFLKNKCKSIVGMANINAKEFQAIPIPKPPVKLQKRFAIVVQSVEQQRSRLRTHLAELDTLFASLQARAFAGEL